MNSTAIRRLSSHLATLVLLVLAVAFAACSDDDDSPDDPMMEQPIKMGWIGPLTGPIAAVGIDNVRGVELAVSDINAAGGIAGRPVELIVEDSVADVDTGKMLYQRMKDEDQVDVVLIKDYGTSLELAADADADQMVVVNTIDTSEQLAAAGDYVFSVGIYDEAVGYTLAEFVHGELDTTEAAVLYADSGFMTLVQESFVARFGELGGTVPVNVKYTFDTSDYQALLQPIIDGALTTVILLGFEEAGSIIALAGQEELGLTFLGADTFTSGAFLENAGAAAEGVYLTSWSSSAPEYGPWLMRYVDKFSEEPEQPLFSAVGYDAVNVVAEAMKSGVRGSALHDAMYALTGLTGITGPLEMSADGAVRSVREEMFRIQGGQFVKVE